MQGIYKIKNNINGKAYIGQSIDIQKRWGYHKHCAFNPQRYNYNYPLYQAIRKYGLDNFTFEVLEEVQASALLTEKEQHYYDAIRKENLYNILAPTENTGVLQGNAVYQIKPKTLRVVAQYESIRDAGRAVNVDAENIRNLLAGNGQMAGGYHWCLKEDWTADWRPKELVYTHQPKAVVLIDENNDQQVFDSIRDAARSVVPDINVHTARRSIARACAGIHQTAYGYKWRFAAEVI